MKSGNGDNGGNLRSEYERYSRLAERVALLILVGLAVEIAAVFILHKPRLEGALTIAATALIAIGVWGEILLEKRAKTAGDGLVAQAEARAAEAQLELAKYRAIRVLSPEQWDRVFEKIRPLGPRSFDIAVQLADPEADRCANGFWYAFRQSDWTQIDWLGAGRPHPVMPGRGTVSISGLTITKDLHNDDPGIIEAVRTLAEALTAEGLEAHVQQGIIGIAEISGNNPTIHILIGRKM